VDPVVIGVPGCVEFDERAVVRHPYDPKCLSNNRRLDGMVHDW